MEIHPVWWRCELWRLCGSGRSVDKVQLNFQLAKFFQTPFSPARHQCVALSEGEIACRASDAWREKMGEIVQTPEVNGLAAYVIIKNLCVILNYTHSTDSFRC